MKRGLILLLLLTTTILSGCSLFSSKDNIQPPTPQPVFTPTLRISQLWDVTVGDGTGSTGIRMRPVVSDGVVYAASPDGTLAAYTLATGAQICSTSHHWFGQRNLRYSGGPAVVGNLLVIGSQNGHVYAYAAKTGKPLWKAPVSSEVITPPVIVGHKVFVRSNDGHVYALNTTNGKQLWLYDRSDVPLLSLRGNGELLAVGGAIIFGSDAGKLIAISQKDGSNLWRIPVAAGTGRSDIQKLDDSDGRVVFDNGVLYVDAYHGNLMAIQAKSGRVLWSRPFSSYTGVAIAGTQVIAVDDHFNIWAMDQSNGGDLWKQTALQWHWLAAPAIQKGYVVLGGLKGYVYWLNITNGKFAASEQLSSDPIRSRPVVAGAIVLVEDVRGHLAAYHIASK
ncbi:MAG TPA: outer membrane protein assembly factor BamB [Mizugakiibacter sp.]|nr:outer membrane protein assembly factor BamB [Mizugakiibacter sp.]